MKVLLKGEVGRGATVCVETESIPSLSRMLADRGNTLIAGEDEFEVVEEVRKSDVFYFDGEGVEDEKGNPIDLYFSKVELPGGITVILDNDNGSASIRSERKDMDPWWRSAMDALESLILAQACSGVDITTKGYRESIQTALDAIESRMT